MFTTLNMRVTGSAFPVITDLTSDLLALPGLLGWCAPQASTLTLDTDGRVAAWRGMNGAALPFVARTGANRPLWTTDLSSGRRGAQFTSSRGDVLDWTGSLPHGAGGKFSAFLIAALPAAGSFTYIAGYDSSYAPGRNALAYNNSALRSIVVNTQPVADVPGLAPAGETQLVGYAHDQPAGRLSSHARGTTVTVAHAGALAQGQFSLGHSAIEANRPNMTLFDVFLLDRDELATAGNAIALLQRYAASYRT